jgi:hypothetical protein
MVALLVEALYYKSEGRGFDSRSDIWFSQLTYPSNRFVVLESPQPLTEMSTRNLPGGKGLLARNADNLTTICEPIF